MSLIWPARVSQSPSPAARLGRLAHYASVIPAAYLLWVAWGYDPTTEPVASWIVTGQALLLYLFARGIRFVLAGE